jgi:hypothetical protein
MTSSSSSYPRCFKNRAQFIAWVHAARIANPGPSGYCVDCTPEYKKEMLKADRCAHPAVLFRSFKEDGVIGLRKLKDRKEMHEEVRAALDSADYKQRAGEWPREL